MMTTKRFKKGNPIARTLIMRKGGVHQKSRSAERQKEKRKLRKAVRNAMNNDKATRKKGRRPDLFPSLFRAMIFLFLLFSPSLPAHP